MFSRSVLRRLTSAFVAAEIRRLRGAGSPASPPDGWPETMPLGDDGLGLDSLERMGAIAALAEAFGLDGADPETAVPTKVGEWIDWIARSGGGSGQLSVTTSGSTGIGRACAHDIGDLIDEARHLAGLFADRRRIVALVPGHHLYGLIWTILLPDVLAIPVVGGAIGLSLDLCPGDLVVAVPEQWQALHRVTPRFAPDVQGVSSAGTFPDALGEALRAAGLTRLVDVYGSSETGAIGLRELPATAYALLPRWTLVESGDDWELADGDGHRTPLPDHIQRVGERALRPAGRRDGAVQVAGHNVWPGRVAAMLRRVSGVQDVTVRLGANGRLKAFVVVGAGIDTDVLRHDLERESAVSLSAPEQPKSFAFGEALPRNEMGKVMDWS